MNSWLTPALLACSFIASADITVVGRWAPSLTECTSNAFELLPDGTARITAEPDLVGQWRLDQRGRLMLTDTRGQHWQFHDHALARDVLIIDGEAFLRCPD